MKQFDGPSGFDIDDDATHLVSQHQFVHAKDAGGLHLLGSAAAAALPSKCRPPASLAWTN